MTREEQELSDAVTEVARCAQELIDGAELRPARRGAPYDDGVTVQAEDVLELRVALSRWKEATEAFLASVR